MEAEISVLRDHFEKLYSSNLEQMSALSVEIKTLTAQFQQCAGRAGAGVLARPISVGGAGAIGAALYAFAEAVRLIVERVAQ